MELCRLGLSVGADAHPTAQAACLFFQGKLVCGRKDPSSLWVLEERPGSFWNVNFVKLVCLVVFCWRRQKRHEVTFS